MRIPEKYKKWFTKKAWLNCLRVTVALFVIVWLFELARYVVLSEFATLWQKSLFLILMGFFFTFTLWFLALISPEVIETVFGMLGFKEKEEKSNEDKA